MDAPKFRALDLFCGAGGASMGLHRAGFEVTGVDIAPQKNYPFRFFQADAMTFPLDGNWDLIWASPPCQAYSVASKTQRMAGKEYPDLIDATRKNLLASKKEYIIENVPGAPLVNLIKLNGWMFPKLRVIRERWFECSFFVLTPPPKRPKGLLQKGYACCTGNGTPGWAFKKGITWNTDYHRKAMGIDWMTRKELSQAIPPAYSEFLGRAAIRVLLEKARAAIDTAN